MSQVAHQVRAHPSFLSAYSQHPSHLSQVQVKVKSTYEPSRSPGQSLSWFVQHKVTKKNIISIYSPQQCQYPLAYLGGKRHSEVHVYNIPQLMDKINQLYCKLSQVTSEQATNHRIPDLLFGVGLPTCFVQNLVIFLFSNSCPIHKFVFPLSLYFCCYTINV